jgi:glucose/arabinose dehydrogenase
MRPVPTILLLSLVACNSSAQTGSAAASPQPTPREDVVRVETVASGLRNPWGIAILPDGRMLVTERPGTVRLVSKDGKVSAPLAGAPRVAAGGQGGMLDVTLDPSFAQNRTLYLSFSEPSADGDENSTAVARARLNDAGTALEEVRVIYSQFPKVRSSMHFGSRVVVGKDGTIFVTQGDRFSFRDRAQELNSGLGKVVRINADGSIPQDNPFVGRRDARPEIWSYGHRNVQAAVLHPVTGQLWTVEHGARGGDELNHPEAGKNYGWPVITYGRDYSGFKIGEGVAKDGMEQPVYYWDPVIAPSGMEYYTGDRYAGWKGSFLVGSLGYGALVRLVVTDGKVTLEERYLHDLRERISDVQQGPDGYLYLITDSGDGRILRVLPK